MSAQAYSPGKTVTTYRIDIIHPPFPPPATFLRIGVIHRACDLLNRDTNKVLACLATDPDLIFLKRNEQDVDVEGGEAYRRVDIELGDGGSETGFLFLREGRGVGVDAPERHVAGWRGVRTAWSWRTRVRGG
jgi:hypothetical protein